MRSEGDIPDCYSWATGDCFRCAGEDVPTAVVAELPAPSGDMHELRACRRCLLRILDERARATEREVRRHCGACARDEEDSL